MENSRRKFLKKVAYTAPVVVGMSTLVAPSVILGGTLNRTEFKRAYKADYIGDWDKDARALERDAWDEYKTPQNEY